MPRSGRVPRGQVISDDGWSEIRYTPSDDWEDGSRAMRDTREDRPLPRGVGKPGRRTVTITGQGAEGYHSRNGTRPSSAARHRQLKRHERSGFRPDRVALWAVLLGVMLMLAAATSSHAAVLVAHHASALAGLRPR